MPFIRGMPRNTKKGKRKMKARIIRVRYIPAETFIEQGLKRGCYPNAPMYRGGGGTYRTFYPSHMEVDVISVDDDARRFTLVIESRVVRSITGYERFTRRLFERIRDAAPYEIELERCDGGWKPTRESLADWFHSA